MTREWVHPVQIYYEDTDHSGVVYHANYLRYFERAREHMLGVKEMVRLLEEDGLGFVVYRANLHFKAGARFGDTIQIRTTVEASSAYRLTFQQRAQRGDPAETLVEAEIDLAMVDKSQRLVKIAPSVLVQLRGSAPTVGDTTL